MTQFHSTVAKKSYSFESLKELSGQGVAGAEWRCARGRCGRERRRAGRGRNWPSPTCRFASFVDEPIIPYEDDEVTRLIVDGHDRTAFAPVSDMTVGEFRDWLLRYETTDETSERACAGLDAGDGRRRQQADAQSGPYSGGEQMPRRHPLSQHDRPRRPALDSPAAEPSDRRPGRHRRIDPRWPVVRLRRRGHRHQSGHRFDRDRHPTAAHAG